jgi:predicted RNA-binding protein with PUA-like domain
VREHYPDPTDASGKFVCVDIAAKKPLKKPVTLVAVKAETKLADMELLRLSRLSVQAVTPQQWQIVCKMGGI